MLNKIVHRLLKPRHFWRDVGFDELSELYVSSMLKTFATTLLMIFVPFYLYQHNYTLPAIFALYGFFFAARVVADVASGYMVARFGPKHTMIASCLFQIFSAALFLTVPSQHWPIWLLGVPWGTSASLYFIAYHVEFSKIKHTKHAGREIGYMNMMEKVGAVAGPLVGGFTGTLFGSQYIFLVAVVTLFGSLWPLFLTREPVKTHQHLDFKGLPVTKVRRDFMAWAFLGIENTLCVNLWPFYVSLFALGSGVYAKLGALSAISVVVGIIAAYSIGKIVDSRSGRKLLRISAAVNALSYVFRPFVTSITPALAVTMANDIVTTGYRMPYIKGMYAAADDLPGYRIVYVASMEAMGNIAKSFVWFLLSILAFALSPYSVMVVGFVIAGVASIFIMTEKFKALNYNGTYEQT